MARGANEVQAEKSGIEDLEPYYRLVEMQKQMIVLIQQNAHTERKCMALREQLAQEFEAFTRSRHALPFRLRESAGLFFKRLLRLNGEDVVETRKTFDIRLSQSLPVRSSSAAADRSRFTR